LSMLGKNAGSKKKRRRSTAKRGGRKRVQPRFVEQDTGASGYLRPAAKGGEVQAPARQAVVAGEASAMAEMGNRCARAAGKR